MKYEIIEWCKNERYLRVTDVEPDIVGESVRLYDGSLGWGYAWCSSQVVVDEPDFLATLHAFHHRYGGNQFWRYFRDTGSGPERLTWTQLTDDQQLAVRMAHESHRVPQWARCPGKLRSELRQHFVAYKLLRQLPSGQLLSFYDDTEWAIGTPKVQKARAGHGGGYYVHPDLGRMRELWEAGELVPCVDGDYLAVLCECECGGRQIPYGSGKVACTSCTPVKIIDTWPRR